MRRLWGRKRTERRASRRLGFGAYIVTTSRDHRGVLQVVEVNEDGSTFCLLYPGAVADGDALGALRIISSTEPFAARTLVPGPLTWDDVVYCGVVPPSWNYEPQAYRVDQGDRPGIGDLTGELWQGVDGAEASRLPRAEYGTFGAIASLLDWKNHGTPLEYADRNPVSEHPLALRDVLGDREVAAKLAALDTAAGFDPVEEYPRSAAALWSASAPLGEAELARPEALAAAVREDVTTDSALGLATMDVPALRRPPSRTPTARPSWT